MMSIDDTLNLVVGIVFFTLAAATLGRVWQLYRAAGNVNPFKGARLSASLCGLLFVYAVIRGGTQITFSLNVVTSPAPDEPHSSSGIIITYMNAVPDLIKTMLQVCFLIRWVNVIERLSFLSISDTRWAWWGWAAVWSTCALVAVRAVVVVVSVVDFVANVWCVSTRTWMSVMLYTIAGIYVYSGVALLALGWALRVLWQQTAAGFMEREHWRVQGIAISLGSFSVLLGVCVIIETVLGNRGANLRWLVFSLWIAEAAVLLVVFVLLLRPRYDNRGLSSSETIHGDAQQHEALNVAISPGAAPRGFGSSSSAAAGAGGGGGRYGKPSLSMDATPLFTSSMLSSTASIRYV